MTIRSLTVWLGLIALTPVLGFAKEDCKAGRKQMREASRALRECQKAWRDSLRENKPDPSDDCTGAQKAYIERIQAVKACRQAGRK